MLLPLRGNEKGGWCKPPSSRTDPPKPESESRFGSGHPGKPILYFSWPYIVQTVCQRWNETRKPCKPLQNIDLTFRRQPNLGPIAVVTYKISQVRLRYIQHSGDSHLRDPRIGQSCYYEIALKVTRVDSTTDSCNSRSCNLRTSLPKLRSPRATLPPPTD